MKEQLFKDLDKFRGYTFTDEEARKFCEVFGPILVCNGLIITTYGRIKKKKSKPFFFILKKS